MEVSIKLKERFCKDCNIPINIYQEPYFQDRLKLYDEHYGTLNKWNLFVEEVSKYKTEQDYFEEYNRVKDDAINFIKSTGAYLNFNAEDMNKYSIVHKGLPSKDIYHPSNDGKTFISIDMKKANFSALQFYDPWMFGRVGTWEDFIGSFTDNKHIINSKYIRQVILGNCNPKRHITYEKYLMDMILSNLIEYDNIIIDRVVFFSNDEIIIDISDMSNLDQVTMSLRIEETLKHITIPLKVELFTLNKIKGTSGYCKAIYNVKCANKIKFKSLDSLYLPFVIRHFKNEEVSENDKVFYHNGLLAKFVEVPKISVGVE